MADAMKWSLHLSGQFDCVLWELMGNFIIMVFANSIEFYTNIGLPDQGAIPSVIISTFSNNLEDVSGLALECVNSLLEVCPPYGHILFVDLALEDTFQSTSEWSAEPHSTLAAQSIEIIY
jgi:hypothetical protein